MMSTYDTGGASFEGGWADVEPVAEPSPEECWTDDCWTGDVSLATEVLPETPLAPEPSFDPGSDDLGPGLSSPIEALDEFEPVAEPEPVHVDPVEEPELPVVEFVDHPQESVALLDGATSELLVTEVDAPVIYEEGSLVSQVPVADDLVTVEDVTGTEVYREWAAATGGLDGAPVAGSFVASGALAGPGMIGDAGDVNFWFEQNSQFSCGPSSVAQVLSDFTGVIHPDESVTAARAQQMGWYDPSSGMLPQNVANLLTDQGVPSSLHRDQDFADLEQYLREGRAVVMFLDARDVMPATGYEAYVAADEVENSVQDTVDHFVRVIGIDRAAGVAIIANPGYAGASQVEIPLDQLEEAWNDSTIRSDTQVDRAHMLIVTDGGDPTPDDVQATPVITAEPTPGPVVLSGSSLEVGPEPGLQPGTEPAFDPVTDPMTAAGPPPGSDPMPGLQPAVELPDAAAPSPIAAAPAPVAADADAVQSPDTAPDGSDRGQGARPASRPSIVELPADGVSFPRPSAPVEVALPVEPAELAASASTAAAGPVAEDGDGGAPIFNSVPGWVLIPVTLAAGRIGAALRSK